MNSKARVPDKPEENPVHPLQNPRILSTHLFLKSPAVGALLLWMIVPLAMTLWFSFQNYNLLNPANVSWAGLFNYQYFYTDPAFFQSIWNTLVIVVGVLFITVIGGIGTIEGPIIGTIVYFLLREFLADLGTIYLLFLGALAIVIMLVAPKGIWGYVAQRWNISLFPTGYHVREDRT